MRIPYLVLAYAVRAPFSPLAFSLPTARFFQSDSCTAPSSYHACFALVQSTVPSNAQFRSNSTLIALPCSPRRYYASAPLPRYFQPMAIPFFPRSDASLTPCPYIGKLTLSPCSSDAPSAITANLFCCQSAPLRLLIAPLSSPSCGHDIFISSSSHPPSESGFSCLLHPCPMAIPLFDYLCPIEFLYPFCHHPVSVSSHIPIFL